jgi:phosphohistidine phosphatase
MRTLILVRHAKSSWNEPGVPDRDRPLNERGERDAPRMGARLAKHGVKPDLIVTSPAVRALATAKIMAGKLDYKRGDIRVDDRLYAAEADTLLHVIRELGDPPRCVMLVGHNPEMTELAHRLSSRITHMPTCAVAVFSFKAKSWSVAGDDEPASAELHTPRHRDAAK